MAAMPSSYQIALLLACTATILLLLPTTYGIRCYQCHSELDTGCDEDRPHRQHLRECAPDHNTCMKVATVGYARTHRGKYSQATLILSRICGGRDTELRCRKLDGERTLATRCACNTDECNRAAPAASSLSLWVALSAATAVAVTRGAAW